MLTLQSLQVSHDANPIRHSRTNPPASSVRSYELTETSYVSTKTEDLGFTTAGKTALCFLDVALGFTLTGPEDLNAIIALHDANDVPRPQSQGGMLQQGELKLIPERGRAEGLGLFGLVDEEEGRGRR